MIGHEESKFASALSGYDARGGETEFEFNDVFKYAAATLTATVLGALDSITLGQFDDDEIDGNGTSETLHWMNEDLGDYYDKHRDGIELGSFVGGMVIPGLAAAKAFKLAKSGNTVLGRSARVKEAQRAKALTAVADEGTFAKNLVEAQKSIRFHTLAEGVGEGLLYETSFALFNNQHPYMENDYDVGDYLIGASLGALVGPLRYMGEKKSLRDMLRPIVEDQWQNREVFGRYLANDMGTRISYAGGLAAKIRGMVKTGVDKTGKPLNPQMVNEVADNADLAGNTVVRLISSIMDEPLKVYKDVKGTRVGEVKDAIFASPANLLAYQALKANGALRGATRFKEFTDRVDIEALISNVFTKDAGITEVISGKAASKIFFGKEATKFADDLYWPQGLKEDVSIDNIRVLDASLPLNTKDKAFIAHHLATAPQWKGAKVQLVGKGFADLKHDRSAVRAFIDNDREFTTGLFESIASLQAKGNKELGLKGAAIAHPYFQGRTLSELEALGTLTASMDTTVTVNKAARLGSEIPLDLNKSTGIVDGVWQSGLHAAANTQAGAVTSIRADEPHKLAGIIAETLNRGGREAKWYDITIKPGKAKPVKKAGSFDEMFEPVPLTKAEQAIADQVKGQTREQVELHITRLTASGDNAEQLAVYQKILPGLESAPVVERASGVLTDLDQAYEYLWKQKKNIVFNIMDKGGDIKQAAIYANVQLDVAETIFAGGRDLKRGKMAIMRYASVVPDELERFSTYQAIKIEGKGVHVGAAKEGQDAAFLDEDVMQKTSDTFVNVISARYSANGKNPELQELAEQVLLGDNRNLLLQDMSKALANLGSKQNLWTSVDQGLRELGPLGTAISVMGRDMRDIVNKHVARFQTTMYGLSTNVARDPVSSTQFSMLRQTIQSLNAADAERIKYIEETGKFGWKTDVGGQEIVNGFLKYAGTDEEIILNKTMQTWMQAYMPLMKEKLGLLNASREMWGRPPTKGSGIWFPYEQVQSEFVAFKVGLHSPDDISMVVAKNANELKAAVIEETKKSAGNHRFVFRDIKEGGSAMEWARYNNMAEFGELSVANPSLSKSGIATTSITPGKTDINNFMTDFQMSIWNDYRNITKSANSAIFDKLNAAARTQLQQSQSGAGFLSQKIQRTTSTPELIEKTLLNKSQLDTAPLMDMANNWVSAQMNTALHHGDAIFRDFSSKAVKERDYIKLVADLKEARVPNPWSNVDEWMQAGAKIHGEDIAQHRIAQAQSVLVSLNLRLMELSHAAVTVMSLPVILSAELRFLKDNGTKAPHKIMMEGAKFMQGRTPESAKAMKFADDMGYIRPVVSELSELMRDLPTAKDIFPKHKKIMDWLSIPSDKAEGFSRSYSYAVGYVLAKQKYPEATERLLATYAAGFTARTMGNYVSRQKPVLFQGTFGSMLGLYQTFMLTMGQNLYRYAEAGNRAAIGQLMGTQAAVFGLESLPFFNSFNQVVGEYASDDHNDLIQTTYNVFGDNSDQSHSMAEFILFGMPSATFGAAVYTRGTLDPRSPIGLGADGSINIKPAVVDAFNQAWDVGSRTVGDLYRTAYRGGNIYDMGRVALQGLAAQSLWRPGARYAEMLGLGKSFDQKGSVVSTEAEVSAWHPDTWKNEPFSLFARAIGARPLKEQALRNLKYQASYYNTVDNDRRKNVIKQVRMLASDDSQDINQMSNLYENYIRFNGKHQQWKSVINEAYMGSETPAATKIAEFTERQPAISEIAETYGY